MKKIPLASIPRTYHNNGQHAEQIFRYTLTGRLEKADNIPAEKSADCGHIQIKSARATVCKGADLTAYLMQDCATQYAYVTADFSTAYLMDKPKWKEFCETFGTLTRESDKNGGQTKIRLGHETEKMREWLERA